MKTNLWPVCTVLYCGGSLYPIPFPWHFGNARCKVVTKYPHCCAMTAEKVLWSFTRSLKRSVAGTAFYSNRSNVLFSKHTYFHPQIKCTKGFIGFNLFIIPNLQIHRSVNYYCVETAVTPSVCAGFRTDAAVSWHRLLRRSISGCSVGYESFLVNLSLLCLHLFCVVMSGYLTVFHLNIV